jgi:hypothetical protein
VEQLVEIVRGRDGKRPMNLDDRPIKPPIILDNNGDITFYDTIEEAQWAVEPCDVKTQEYTAYDSGGRQLALRVKVPEPFGMRLRRLLFPVEQTQLLQAENPADCCDELKRKLIAYIDRLQQRNYEKPAPRVSVLIEKAKSIIRALDKRQGGTPGTGV